MTKMEKRDLPYKVEYLSEESGELEREGFATIDEAKAFMKNKRQVRHIRATPLEKYELLTSFHHNEDRMRFKDYWVAMINYCNTEESVRRQIDDVEKNTLYAAQLIIALEPSLKKLKKEINLFFDRCLEESLTVPNVTYMTMSDCYMLTPNYHKNIDFMNKEADNFINNIDKEEADKLEVERLEAEEFFRNKMLASDKIDQEKFLSAKKDEINGMMLRLEESKKLYNDIKNKVSLEGEIE